MSKARWIAMAVTSGLQVALVWILVMGTLFQDWEQALTIGPFVGLGFAIIFPVTMWVMGFRFDEKREEPCGRDDGGDDGV